MQHSLEAAVAQTASSCTVSNVLWNQTKTADTFHFIHSYELYVNVNVVCAIVTMAQNQKQKHPKDSVSALTLPANPNSVGLQQKLRLIV